MSDMESLFEEDDLNNDRELIALVRVNRFLYDKSEKLYANGNVKTAAWTQIGESLTHPVEGLAAEKRFYALRQRFGKERRKVVQSMPRSGAGAVQPTYTPTWELYKDLTFLKDIIKPRKTSSNYKSKASTNSQVLEFSTNSLSTSTPSGQVTVFRTVSPLSVMCAAASSDTSGSWNLDSFQSIASADESSTEISEDPCSSFFLATPPPATSPSATPPPVIRPVATPTSAQSSIKSGSGSNNAVAQVQKTMSKIGTKRMVPPTDSFATKRRQEIDAVNKSFIEQNKRLTDLAAKIGEAMTTPPSQPSVPSTVVSNASPDIQSMLSTIQFSLSAIPEHALVDCFIGVLQYINNFSKTRVDKRSEAK